MTWCGASYKKTCKKQGVDYKVNDLLKYMSEWLVLHLNKKWELQIPRDLRDWKLSWLLSRRVASIIHEGFSGMTSNNRRIANSSILFIDLNVTRQERLHHNTTILPPWSNLERLLDWEQHVDIWEDGIIVLSEDMQSCFSDTNRRTRMLLLQRQRWEKIDGFALSFQPKFPAGNNCRL